MAPSVSVHEPATQELASGAPQPRRRGHRGMLLAGVVALLIVLAAVSTAGLVLARRTAQQGLDQVHRAEALLTVANVRRQPSLTLNKALATLQDARSDFQT